MKQVENIFITGVSSGLGHGLAELYLQGPAQVYGISRHQPENLLQAANFFHRAIDLGDLNSLQEQMAAFVSEVEHFDVVILNAGILGEIKDLQETSLAELRHIMDVNLWANKVLLDLLLTAPRSVDQVVAISSGASVNGHRGWGGYSISKAALNMMTKLYAAEQPSTHFCALAPGLIDTHMQDYLCQEPDSDKFPSLKRLREARGTEMMPGWQEGARRVKEAIPKLLALDSGEYADVRKIVS